MSPVPPSALVAATLVLATFRVTRLLGWDVFPPVARLRARLLDTRTDRLLTERHPPGKPPTRVGRETLQVFIECPYCLGFWVGVAVYASWLLWPTGSLYVWAPLALNGAVGIVARMLDP